MTDVDSTDTPAAPGRKLDLVRRGELRRASVAKANGSPPAIEATLASISDEVMEEAIARRAKRPVGGAGLVEQDFLAIARTAGAGV